MIGPNGTRGGFLGRHPFAMFLILTFGIPILLVGSLLLTPQLWSWVHGGPFDYFAEFERLTRALETLPPRFREVLVLRELEGFSYKEIASITAIPIGTVMSALARARQRLQRALTPASPQEASREL